MYFYDNYEQNYSNWFSKLSFKYPRCSVCIIRRHWNGTLRTKSAFVARYLRYIWCGKFWNLSTFNRQNILLTFFCIGIKTLKKLICFISVNNSLFFLCHFNICHRLWSEKQPRQTTCFQENNELIALSNKGVFNWKRVLCMINAKLDSLMCGFILNDLHRQLTVISHELREK